MATPGVVSRYFDAWNRHDPAAILDCMNEGALYRDPYVPEGVTGGAFARYAARFFSRMPDARFDILAVHACEEMVVVEWVMRAAPRVVLPGIDVITVAGDAILQVRGYYDRLNFDAQRSRTG